MEDHKKLWNKNQKELRQKLPKAIEFQSTIQLLLKHHAMLHTSTMANLGVWSYEDDLWLDLHDVEVRHIPLKQEHSIIWVMWHLARVEDVTMNMLVAGSPQILHAEKWFEKLNVPFEHTGNEINRDDMISLNTSINIDALKDYRKAVGQRTQAIIKTLSAETVQQKIDPVRVEDVRQSSAVLEAASGIIDYWSKRTVAGLLLMSATRHNLVHLNEASRIKQILLKQR